MSTKGQQYDIGTNGLRGWEGVAEAIVLQAIADWRWLCKGNMESFWCNFRELKYFFKHESGLFIRSDKGTEQRIWEKLKEEKRAAGL